MAKRRANGEGSIRKRKDGRWEGRYTAGRDPATGKAIYKNVLGKTQAEVKAKLKSAIEKSGSLATAAERYTVGQWLDAWMENYAKLQVRASPHKTYQGFIENHIKPTLGDIPLEKLMAMDLQRLYKHLLESGRVKCTESRNKSKGLSVKTVRNINQMISSALNCAVEQRLIPSNPAKDCVLTKLERKEMKILPPESLGTFFEEARRSGVFELYYIDLATGLRRGELLGLKWSDIDLDKGIIHVRRQILRQNGEVVEAPLKTKNSYRNIAIGADTLPRLPSHILGAGPAKRSRRENPLRHAGSLQRWVYPGCLRPRHRLHAEAGGERGGEFPLRCPSDLTTPGSLYGSRLGTNRSRKIKLLEKVQKAKAKPLKFFEFQRFWYALMDSNPRPSGPQLD